MKTTKSLTIDFAVPGDSPFLFDLIKELAIFEKAGDQVLITFDDLDRAIFSDEPMCKVLVARSEGTIAGMALFYHKYSTWTGGCVYLEDLIVSEKYRGQGIGTELFLEVARYAHCQNAGRLEWQVLDWNTSGIEFYKKYDAMMDHSWVNCKLTRSQLSELMSKNKV